MVIRAADTIALQHLTETYRNLSACRVTLATPKSTNTVPAIDSMQPHSAPELGGLTLAPLAYITAKTLAAGAVQHSGVRSIPELFEALHKAGEQVYGVFLPWGVLDCSQQLTAQYVHEFMLFHQRNNKSTPISPGAHRMKSDTIMTLLQVRFFGWRTPCWIAAGREHTDGKSRAPEEGFLGAHALAKLRIACPRMSYYEATWNVLGQSRWIDNCKWQ